MSDTENTQPQGEQQQTSQAPATAQAPAERVFTQAEVDRIVAERLGRAKAKQGPVNTGATSNQVSNQQAGDAGSNFAAFDVELNDAIDEVTEETGIKIPLALKKRLRVAFRSERPQDPTAWVKGWVSDTGLAAKATAPTATTATTTNEPNNGAPTPSAAVPPSMPPPAASINLEEISDPSVLVQHMPALVQKYGHQKASEMLTRAGKAHLEKLRVLPPVRQGK